MHNASLAKHACVACAVLLFLSYLPLKADAAIVIYGDTQAEQGAPPTARNYAVHRSIISEIKKITPLSAVFNCGDLVNNGTDRTEWFLFGTIAGSLIQEQKYFPAIGNHDAANYGAGISQFYIPIFNYLPNSAGNNFKRWYSIAKENVFFVVLDSTLFDNLTDYQIRNSTQFRWLEDTLRTERDAINRGISPNRFIVVIMHYPPFSSGPHAADPVNASLKNTLAPLFDQYGVSLVFGGHNHMYERSAFRCANRAITYIVTGGGGGTLNGEEYPEYNPYSQIRLCAHNYCKLTVIAPQYSPLPLSVPTPLLVFEAFQPIASGVTKRIDAFMVNPLNTPGNLTITRINGSQAKLAWEDLSDNEDGFTILESPGPQLGVYLPIATIARNCTSIDLNCRPNYFYTVKAFNYRLGTSNLSNEVCATP